MCSRPCGHALRRGRGMGILAICPSVGAEAGHVHAGVKRDGGSPVAGGAPTQLLAQGVPPAFEGPAECDLVGVFEVAAHGQA